MMGKISTSRDSIKLGYEPKITNCIEQRACFSGYWCFDTGNMQRSAMGWVVTFRKLVNLTRHCQQTGKNEKLTCNLPLSLTIDRWFCFELSATDDAFYQYFLVRFNLHFVADILHQHNVNVIFASTYPLKVFGAAEILHSKTIERGRPRKVIIAILSYNGSSCAA